VTVGVLLLLAAAIAAALSLPVAGLLLLAAPASLAWQYQEYFRRVLYTEERYRALVFNDVVSYGGQLMVVAVLYGAGRLSGINTLAAVATTSALAALIGIWQVRRSLSRRFFGPAVQENWAFGKWLLAAPAYWLSTQLYLYAAAAVLGLAVAGALKAAQMLMGPLHLLFAAFESVLPVRFARIHQDEGDRGLDGAVLRTFITTVPIVAVYCLAVIVLARPLLSLVYGRRYAGYELVVTLFAVYYFVLYVATILSARLRARQEVRPVFFAYVWAAAISVILLGLVPIVRTVGALAGIVVGALALSLFLWRPGSATRETPAATAAPRRHA
jgi:O-antigen/teichoic acid export membrane protein